MKADLLDGRGLVAPWELGLRQSMISAQNRFLFIAIRNSFPILRAFPTPYALAHATENAALYRW